MGAYRYGPPHKPAISHNHHQFHRVSPHHPWVSCGQGYLYSNGFQTFYLISDAKQCKITSQYCVKAHFASPNINALPAAVDNVPLIDAVVPSTHKRTKALMVRITIALAFLAVFGIISAAAGRLTMARLSTKIVCATNKRSVAILILNARICHGVEQ